MTKYHIHPDRGPLVCRATKQACKYGTAEDRLADKDAAETL